MADQAFPPGYRFSPTDQELLGYCLSNKISGAELDPRVASCILETDLYGPNDPEQVYATLNISVCDSLRHEFYFFTFVKKKSSNGKGKHMERVAGKGNWKSMGHPRPVYYDISGALMGKKITLNFQIDNKNCTPSWIMHEYTLPNSDMSDHWAICRILRGNQTKDLPMCNNKNKRTIYDDSALQYQQNKKMKQCVGLGSTYELSNMCSGSSSQPQHYIRPQHLQAKNCQTFAPSTSSYAPPTETTGAVTNHIGFASQPIDNLLPQLDERTHTPNGTTCVSQETITIDEGQVYPSPLEPSTLPQPTELLTSRIEVPVEPLSQCGFSEESIFQTNELISLDEIFADSGSNRDFEPETLIFPEAYDSDHISEFQNPFWRAMEELCCEAADYEWIQFDSTQGITQICNINEIL